MQRTVSAPPRWWWNRQFANVILVSTGFMFVTTTYFTTSAISNSVIHDMVEKYGFHEGDGYIALALVCGSTTLFSAFAPFVASVFGGKWTMIIGGCSHLLYIGSFMFYSRMLLFCMSAVFGCGFALYWVGGNMVLAVNTDVRTADKCNGIFWVLYNFSQIWGNTFITVKFSRSELIDDETRHVTFGVLIVTAIVGNIIFLFVKQQPAALEPVPSRADGETQRKISDVGEEHEVRVLSAATGPSPQPLTLTGKAFLQLRLTLRLFCSPLMLTSWGFFVFTGINVITIVSPIPTAVGFNKHFGDMRKSLMGVNGFCVGIAEIVGGTLIVVSAHYNLIRRRTIFLFGTLLSALAITLSVLNFPLDSTVQDSDAHTVLFGNDSSLVLFIVCAFLFGFSDACTNVTMMALVSDVFGHEHEDENLQAVSMEAEGHDNKTVERLVPSASNDDVEEGHRLLVRRRKSASGTRCGDEDIDDITSPHQTIVLPARFDAPRDKLTRQNATAVGNAMLNAIQSVLQTVVLFLSASLWLHWYLIILVSCGIWAGITFYIIDKNYRAGKYKDEFRA